MNTRRRGCCSLFPTVHGLHTHRGLLSVMERRHKRVNLSREVLYAVLLQVLQGINIARVVYRMKSAS